MKSHAQDTTLAVLDASASAAPLTIPATAPAAESVISVMLDGATAEEIESVDRIVRSCPSLDVAPGANHNAWLPNVILIVVESGLVVLRAAGSGRRNVVVADAARGAFVFVAPGCGELQALTRARLLLVDATRRDALLAVPAAAVIADGLETALAHSQDVARGRPRGAGRDPARLPAHARAAGRHDRDGSRDGHARAGRARARRLPEARGADAPAADGARPARLTPRGRPQSRARRRRISPTAVAKSASEIIPALRSRPSSSSAANSRAPLSSRAASAGCSPASAGGRRNGNATNDAAARTARTRNAIWIPVVTRAPARSLPERSWPGLARGPHGNRRAGDEHEPGQPDQVDERVDEHLDFRTTGFPETWFVDRDGRLAFGRVEGEVSEETLAQAAALGVE